MSGDASGERTKTVVFDMDGVLVDSISSWVLIHEHFGTNNDEAVEMFKAGLLDDKAFIRSDIEKWTKAKGAPVHIEEINRILLEAPLTQGVRETFNALKEKGYRIYIVSGGIDILCRRIKEEMGIDGYIANSFLTDEKGYLTGEARIGVYLRKKDEALERLCKSEGIPLKKGCLEAVVGDTFIDAQMFPFAKKKIAFNPRDEMIKRAADVVLFERDLRCVLKEIISG